MFDNLKQAVNMPSNKGKPLRVEPFSIPRLLTVHLHRDEIILQNGGVSTPSAAKKRLAGRAIRLRWDSATKPELLDKWKEQPEDDDWIKFETAGLVGLLRLFGESYLFFISSSRTAGHLVAPSRAAYAIDSVLPLPLNYEQARVIAFDHINKRLPVTLNQNEVGALLSDADIDSDTEDEQVPEADANSQTSGSRLGSPIPTPIKRSNLGMRGMGLGRYLWRNRPKSRSTSKSASMSRDASTSIAIPAMSAMSRQEMVALAPEPESIKSPADIAARQELNRKVVRELSRELRGMYFALDWDLTQSVQKAWDAACPPTASTSSTTTRDLQDTSSDSIIPRPQAHIPLWKRFDKRFFWNQHLMTPFIIAGADGFILPIMQGFFQSKTVLVPLPLAETFPLPKVDNQTTSNYTDGDAAVDYISLSLTLISRRSVERPGLRFQRRGADDQGHCANFVETEFVIGAQRDGVWHVGSFVQTRGSVPLFWSQTSWALKPPPILERSAEENASVLKAHFSSQTALYGPTTCVCLAEETGPEGKLVSAFREGVEALGDPQVQYIGWDFHHETKGIRYENISKLMDILGPNIKSNGYFWATSTAPLSRQSGVFRTNCIDCLDRTNVVQSALARQIMYQHLIHLGVDGAGKELDPVFNDIWANNGDAISLQCRIAALCVGNSKLLLTMLADARTSALKGDFVRTGRRDWRGMLNDATNSLARMWQNHVADFFGQATIDFVLGINLSSFSEFQQTLKATDPGEILRLTKIRAVAVETSSALVVPEDEKVITGCTLLSPSAVNKKSGDTFEEKVLLITQKAVYVISYEYTLQKVRDFTRVLLGDIIGIQRGEYILSSIDESARDSLENYGFLFHYRTREALERVNTYSLNVEPKVTTNDIEQQPTSFIAFKAMRRHLISENGNSSHGGNGSHSEGNTTQQGEGTRPTSNKCGKLVIESIVDSLIQACEQVGTFELNQRDTFVTESPIISLAEAEKSTGFLSRVTHDVKHLIWL